MGERRGPPGRVPGPAGGSAESAAGVPGVGRARRARGWARGGTRGGGTRGVLLFFATLAQMGVSFIQQGIVVLGVFFAATYHLTLPQMGIVVSCGTTGWMLAGLVMGTLVDRYGPRRVTVVATVAMVVLALGLFLARDLLLTCALLVLLGIAFGGIPLSGTKAVLMAWPRAERGLPMGVRQMGVPLGSLLAAMLLPTLAGAFGLHGVFLIFAVQVLLVGVAFQYALAAHRPSPLPDDPHPATRQATPGATPPTRLVTILALPAVCGFLMAWGQYVLLTYTIPMLQSRGIVVAAAGVVLGAAQVGGALGRIVFGALSDRLAGRRDLVLAGIASCGAVLALVVSVLPKQLGFLWLVVLWLLLGASMVGWNALMLTWAGERVAVAASGTAMGLETSAVLLGAVISAPIFGYVVETTGSYRDAWISLALVLGTAAVLLTTGVRRNARLATQAYDQREAADQIAPSAS